MYYDTAYRTYMAQYWDVSKTKPATNGPCGSQPWHYQPTAELNNAAGLKMQQLADRGVDAEEGHGDEALSDYGKSRKARIEANEAFLVPLGLGPAAPRLTAQRPWRAMGYFKWPKGGRGGFKCPL